MTSLCFLIPLRPKKTSLDWELVSRLCIQTVLSCLKNASSEIQVWVIGNEEPEGFRSIRDERLRFLMASKQPPVEYYGEEGMRDKWNKLAQGLIELSKNPTDYFMFVDADDLVSSKIHSFLESSRPKHGLILKDGYRYKDGSKWIEKVMNTFNCGTNSIISTNAVKLPRFDTLEETKRCVALTAGHSIIEEVMANRQTSLARCPFPAAVYVTHREQHSLNGSQPSSLIRDILNPMKRKLRNPSRFLLLRLARPVLRKF